MSATTDRLSSAAFLFCLALTACNSDRPDGDGYAQAKPETVVQPKDMPAPQPAAPEALQGNNHSSPAVGGSKSIKKSSTIMPRMPRVIWV